jgi:hypothetical protein
MGGNAGGPGNRWSWGSGWVLGFSLFEYCLRAEMCLRCRQTFPGKERCLLDHFWDLLQSVLHCFLHT